MLRFHSTGLVYAPAKREAIQKFCAFVRFLNEKYALVRSKKLIYDAHFLDGESNELKTQLVEVIMRKMLDEILIARLAIVY